MLSAEIQLLLQQRRMLNLDKNLIKWTKLNKTVRKIMRNDVWNFNTRLFENNIGLKIFKNDGRK